MDTDTLFIRLGDIFINTMEAKAGELCELAGTEPGIAHRERGEEERELKNKKKTEIVKEKT